MAHVPIAQCKSDHSQLSHNNRSFSNPEDLNGRNPYIPAMNTSSSSIERIDMGLQERLPHYHQDWSSADGNNWQWRRIAQQPGLQSSVSFPLSMMNSVPGTQDPVQRPATVFDNGSSLDFRVSADPFVATYTESQIRPGYDPVYGYVGVQDLESKPIHQPYSWPSWIVPSITNFTDVASASTSDSDNRSSMPLNYSGIMCAADRAQLATEPVMDEASTSHGSRQYHGLSSLGIGGPSSVASLIPGSSCWHVQPQRTAFTNDNSKLAPSRQQGLGASTKKLGPVGFSRQNLLDDPQPDTKPSNTAHVPGDRVGLMSPAAPLATNITQIADTIPKPNPDTNISHDNPGSLYKTTTWRHARQIMPAPEQIRSRLQSAQLVEAHTQRETDDRILLDGKKNGLTYKEIARQMHGQCAESTLRGRYRSLTKARKDRVRKPVWRQVDIELLTRRVHEDLNRIAVHHPSLKYEQRLSKVQWKNVASYIEENGGSYHFGNSTCKRKWMELYPTL